MNRITKIALEYFRPPNHHFWHWAENGEVLEWQSGRTICYREDLIPILTDLAPDGLPPLGTVLLILGAAQDEWKDANQEKELLDALVQNIKTQEDADLEDFLVFAMQFLDMISELPKELRSGTARVRLLQELAACMPHKIIGQQAQSLIHEFDTGNLDELTLLETVGGRRKRFVMDLENLQHASGVFKDAETLEKALKTGLLQEPKPATLHWQEEEPLDLLAQLAKNRKTKGFSNLTRRLIAALNIPMQASGSGDLPLGGVSDITNRGDFDRLLLSELANDDLSLTVRLVNNEALYLRREEPPSKLIHRRTILVDTSIKMWGVPRVFAVSAALACAQNNKYDVPLQAFAMGGQGYSAIHLGTVEGVMEALEVLDGALHCGSALQRFFKHQTLGEEECIFITDEHQFSDADFLAHFAEIKQKINFLITVARSGELHFFQLIAGRKKHLSKSKFDLEELLFPSQQRNSKSLEGLPKFMQQHPAPLHFPAARVLLNTKRYCFLPGIGCLAVSELQHLLFWPESRTGASELLDYVEPGQYYFGQDGNASAFMLVHTRTNKVILYEFDAHNWSIMDRFSQQLENVRILQVAFQDVCFYIQTNHGVYTLNCDQDEIPVLAAKRMQVPEVFKQNVEDTTTISKKEIKKFINNGYSVLQHVNRIYINEKGLLCLDSRAFQFINHNSSLSLSPVESTKEKGPAAMFNYKKIKLTTNKYIQFKRAVWENGSEALIDPRGFLHLRSANPTVPELTFVLVLDRNIACWSSDGTICGSLYFTARSSSSGELARSFYDQYIQAFINALD